MMSLADQVADLRRHADDEARRADAVWDESPAYGRMLFEKAARYKAQADSIEAGDPAAVALAEGWENDEPGEPALSPSEVAPPVTVFETANGRASVGYTDGSDLSKRRLLEAAGYWAGPPVREKPSVVTKPRTRSDSRPRERRAGSPKRARAPGGDADPEPPPPSDTPLQRALAAAWLLDGDTFAVFADHVRIRLDWFEGGETA